MIQALVLLKFVTTKKKKKNNMEGINMEGSNIAEVAETPTFIDLSSFFRNSTIKTDLSANLQPTGLLLFVCLLFAKNNPVYPAGAKAVTTGLI